MRVVPAEGRCQLLEGLRAPSVHIRAGGWEQKLRGWALPNRNVVVLTLQLFVGSFRVGESLPLRSVIPSRVTALEFRVRWRGRLLLD